MITEFEREFVPCVRCRRFGREHVNDKCLFGATTFTPMTRETYDALLFEQAHQALERETLYLGQYTVKGYLELLLKRTPYGGWTLTYDPGMKRYKIEPGRFASTPYNSKAMDKFWNTDVKFNVDLKAKEFFGESWDDLPTRKR